MRDDIHKGAPVPARWQVFIKHSASEAYWRIKSQHSAQEAVSSVARGIRPSTLDAIEKLIGASQISIAGPMADLEQVRAQRPLNTLENCLFDRLIEEGATGPLSHDALFSSVKGALSERMEANMRATEIHVQTKSPHDRPELMRRLRNSLEQVDLEATCTAVLERRVLPAKRKPGFDWEENLGAPK